LGVKPKALGLKDEVRCDILVNRHDVGQYGEDEDNGGIDHGVAPSEGFYPLNFSSNSAYSVDIAVGSVPLSHIVRSSEIAEASSRIEVRID
jgi:hypothetical protein